MVDIGVDTTRFAGVLDPLNPSQAYFFAGNRYAVVDLSTGAPFGTVVRGPEPIASGLPSLFGAGITGIDAALPVPGSDGELDVFSAGQVVRISLRKPGAVAVLPPRKITDAWPSLQEAAFEAVDAAVLNPANNLEAFIFSGDRYAVLRDIAGQASLSGAPALITDDWAALKQAGFTVVDAVLPNPANQDEIYVFSGGQSILVNIGDGIKQSTLLQAAKPIRDEWPSLQNALFT